MKTIEEQIEEAQAERDAIGKSLDMEYRDADNMNALNRLWLRAVARLATLEAVRDGRAVEVYATVYCNRTGEWAAHGAFDVEPNSGAVKDDAGYCEGDSVTNLRGYVAVPKAHIDEVEADSEVPS